MITLRRFRLLEAALRTRGYGAMIDWSENIGPASSADDFAERTIYVICNSGMSNRIAVVIYDKCLEALHAGQSATTVFGHPGKSLAIDAIWRTRKALYAGYRRAEDKTAFLELLPWIGEVTAQHLAKNLGSDVAKPDVHMERLARADRTTTAKLCARLAKQTGYRVATIDSVLWRACAERILLSAQYEAAGWKAAFKPD